MSSTDTFSKDEKVNSETHNLKQCHCSSVRMCDVNYVVWFIQE